MLTGTVSTLSAQKYMVLHVRSGAHIDFKLRAKSDNTQVKVCGGVSDTIFVVGKSWTSYYAFNAISRTIAIYGDLVGLDCIGNGYNITYLDVSQNPALEELLCDNNSLSSLDVSKNPLLEKLSCYNCILDSIDVSKNPALKILYCEDNYFSSLDVSKNPALEELHCSHNNLSSLDVSKNTLLRVLYCYHNNLSSLDVSKNPKLETLECYNNRLSSLKLRNNKKLDYLRCDHNLFNTAAFDAIMCALPEQISGHFYPLFDSTDYNAGAFMSANSNNATSKGWKVRYYLATRDISTKGTYECPDVDMGISIRLGVKNARVVNLHFAAAADNTPVTLVCGSTDTTFYVRKYISYGDMHHFSLYTSDTEVNIYGALTHFRCSGNHDHITSLDVSGNPALKGLLCYENSITSLDVSGNPALEELLCYDNGLTSLNLGADTALTILSCYKNRLTSLDVSRCAALTELRCQLNQLTLLDVSHNPRMEVLYCHSNSIPTLDLGGNPALKVLGCRNNALTTAEYDKIMCMLPERTAEAKFFPLGDSLDTNYNLFMATNSANATAKGWKILYGSNNKPVPATTGDFDCITLPVSEAAAEHALRVWPNPARTQLRIANATGEVCVYDLAGRVVYRSGQAVPEELQINISGWAKGMYFVRAGGMTVKFVKE